MHVVDASVWVSRFVASDAYHADSRRWLGERVANGDLIAVPAVALAEIAGAVARRTGRSELGLRAMSLVRRLPIVRLVSVDMELAVLGAEAAAELGLRGADALYVALARRLNAPLVTWDQEQRVRSQATIAVLAPAEATP